ncbi:GLPGLI family protein [Chryseobacterium sp. SSA4.19]|uniref:GLPGLI family protein n=1 Tax=Chryseobacterium sp. SSA4.19 TaxID=2919915 RepID=UPI001F4D912A|nr:GLPGLI family protein [Chryseobacterium sp. SSA4.19]MCJ8154883.1 GLPGLI family protein [Chryseobacterium sp. SSA4.19]
MMRNRFFLFLFLSVLFNAQNQRFTYDYSFIPDSANISDIKKEMMNLDVSKSGSKFYSYTVYRSDSLMKVDLEKQLAASGSMNVKSDNRKGLVRYTVSKTYPKYEVFFHNRILRDQYKVSEERPIVWTMTSEKLKIGEWSTQKAETDFAGRHWYAWFTTDIPIQDGPYKFHGLPGLIVKLEDQTQSHRFMLQAVKSISSIPEDIFGSHEISVNSKQYGKLVKEYEDYPTKGLKQIQMGGAVMIMKEGQNPNMKDQEKRIKERMKKDNNKIELNTI